MAPDGEASLRDAHELIEEGVEFRSHLDGGARERGSRENPARSRGTSFDPAAPKWVNRDRFVLSNGHGSMLLYSLLHLTGYDLSMDEILGLAAANQTFELVRIPIVHADDVYTADDLRSTQI